VKKLKIQYEPFEEIIIREFVKFENADDLARFASIVAGGKPTGLYWTDGILFLYFPLPATTETAAKALVEEKKVYWTFVGFALLPDYKKIIETREKIMVPVIDMSPNPTFKKVAQWLKEAERKRS
jgi:hypothetical protein